MALSYTSIMVLYNTTFVMAPATVGEFIDFMRTHYLPVLERVGQVEGLRLHRVLREDSDVDSESYALHFYVPSGYHLQELLSDHGLGLAQRLVDTFGERVLGFSTILEEVSLELTTSPLVH